MSWDFDLCDPVSGDVITIDEPHFMRGGTYKIGGNDELTLNITFNYTNIICKAMGLEQSYGHIFNGKTALETIPMLEKAIANLGDDVNPDYWEPTEGNAKRALIQLLTMAKMRPDGVWKTCG